MGPLEYARDVWEIVPPSVKAALLALALWLLVW